MNEWAVSWNDDPFLCACMYVCACVSVWAVNNLTCSSFQWPLDFPRILFSFLSICGKECKAKERGRSSRWSEEGGCVEIEEHNDMSRFSFNHTSLFAHPRFFHFFLYLFIFFAWSMVSCRLTFFTLHLRARTGVQGIQDSVSPFPCRSWLSNARPLTVEQSSLGWPWAVA